MKKLSFAIIGAGPAAFYTSKKLAKLPCQPIIHMFEKQYCPFGLIRYGVAPDHISIKKSETTLSSISDYSFFQYFGNQYVSQKLLKELQQKYSAIIYAIGAQSNNQPEWMTMFRSKQVSEIGKTILNARDIVYWYNDHPSSQKVSIDLKSKRDVAIVGNGNVAIDIARILLKKTEDLINTEISLKALHSLKESDVRNVTLIGRRGIIQSAFALKQIRQLTSCGIKIYYVKEEMTASMNESSLMECHSAKSQHTTATRMNRRKLDFISQKCHSVKKQELNSLYQNTQRKVILRYLIDPLQLVNNNQIKLVRTQLKGDVFQQTVAHTPNQEVFRFDLLVNSTGFRVEPLAGQQLHKKGNRILNHNGCVISQRTNQINVGQYAVGWCKSGPRGVIDETLISCEQTFNSISQHIQEGVLPQKHIPVFARTSNATFARYLQLKQLQLQLGDKAKFVKRKLGLNQLQKFFS